MEETILVTGGSGFIGSNFILRWFQHEGTPVVNLDNLTYAGNPRNLSQVCSDPRYCFVRGDVCDRTLLRGLIKQHRPRAIVHFAAESHGVVLKVAVNGSTRARLYQGGRELRRNKNGVYSVSFDAHELVVRGQS